MSNSTSNTTKVTLNESAIEFLEENYPFAMSNAERIRLALNDARAYRELTDNLEMEDVDEE